MSKKRKGRRVSKSGPVWHLSAEEATMLRKPRYNGFACGTGPHGDAKYNRTREKRAWKKGLRNGGLSLYLGYPAVFLRSCPNRCRVYPLLPTGSAGAEKLGIYSGRSGEKRQNSLPARTRSALAS